MTALDLPAIRARAEAETPIDFANWTYNTLPERTGNVGWQPDLQDLIYTAINHVEGDYEDADENCAEQVIERLVLAIKAMSSERTADRLAMAAKDARIAELEENISQLRYVAQNHMRVVIP